MAMSSPSPAGSEAPAPTFTIERWQASSSNARESRASLVLVGGGRRWRAHASGNGAIDALMRAVDEALPTVLGPGIELLTYNVHATGHGHATAAAVTLTVRPRDAGSHAPAYPGRAVHENVLEASLAAYVDAINALVAHGDVDVAAAAPQPQQGKLAEQDIDESRSTARNRLMGAYND